MIPIDTLSNGLSIPKISCGTWTYNDEAACENVLRALEVGFRAIDTAAYYQNESGVGKAILESGIPRNQICVTSKVWKTVKGYENAKRSIEESLDRLKLDYIDLMLIHWPTVQRDTPEWKEVNANTWLAFEEFYSNGLIRAIGVSNFKPIHLEALNEMSSISPMLNQIEFHPGFTQIDTVDYCRLRGITVQAWSPFGRGEAFHNEVVLNIAKKHNQSVARVIVTWLWKHNVNPIVKASRKEHLLDLYEMPSFDLTDDEMREIDGIAFFGRLGYDPETKTFE